MILTCAEFVGRCDCGQVHELDTKYVVVDHGCLKNFEMYMQLSGLSGRRTVIYDTNTYNIPGLVHVDADKEIVLEAEGLHAEKEKIESILPQMEDPDVIIAVGSGTIMDFARYNAFKLGIPFVAIPTLASADGYTANICSIIVDGHKRSIAMQAPVLVVADLDVISQAPRRMLLSGLADMLSKYVSLADWYIANAVADEYYCGNIASIQYRALQMASRAAMDIKNGAEPDYGEITMALMISGIAMQMMGNSRPASGAEHLIAHLVEMKPPRFENAAGLHGECVGVGTILCAEAYHEIAEKKPTAKEFQPLDKAWVEEKFGPLAESVLKENEDDVLKGFHPKAIEYMWGEVQEAVNTIPRAETLRQVFKALGMKTELSEIGIDESLKPEILDISAAVRNRLTLARLRRMMELND